MDVFIVTACSIALLSAGTIMYISGWKAGGLKALSIISFVVLYGVIVKFFGHDGKNIMTAVLVVTAIAIMLSHKKSGKDIF